MFFLLFFEGGFFFWEKGMSLVIYLFIYLNLIYGLLFPILKENSLTFMEFIYTAVYVSIYLYNTLFYRV